MQAKFSKLIIALSLTGAASFALGTSCATKESVLPMVQNPTRPALVALYSGRYSMAKGIGCSWVVEPTPPPRVSVLVASQDIWIGLSYDGWAQIPAELGPYLSFPQTSDQLPLTFDEYGYFPAELGPKDRRWTIRSENGRHDWSSARSTLLEVRALIEAHEQEPASQAEFSGLSAFIDVEPYSMEIAAEDEVPYESILAAIDLAVATDFEDFAYVDPLALPEWLKE